jgi:UMF1 family MFS transporter
MTDAPPSVNALPEASRSASGRSSKVWAWIIADASPAPYFSLVNLFVFSAYFTIVVVGDPVRGQVLWSNVATLAALALAIGGPIVGAIADAGGRLKPWIAVCILIALPGMIGLSLATPGMGPEIFWVLAALLAAAVGTEFIPIFATALLPKVVEPKEVGPIIGLAMATTNVLSFAALLFFLAAWSWSPAPLFGLEIAAGGPQRAVGPISAVVLLLLSLPFFLLTPDAPPTRIKAVEAIARALASLKGTFAKVRRYPNTAAFMGARMIYMEGFLVLAIFTGVFAAGVMRWPATTLAVQGLINTACAVAGGLLASWLDRRLGARLSVVVTVIGCLVATSVLSVVTADSVFFMPVADDPAAGGPFPTLADKVFSAAQGGIALFTGLGVAATRTLTVRLSPKEMLSEFLGFFASTGRATAFLGPLAVGVATAAFQNQRAVLAVAMVFLVAGLVWMLFVKDPVDD